jgi:hypothetical protein
MKDNQIRIIPMNALMRVLCLGLLLVLSACGTVEVEPSLPWYVGEFHGSKSQDGKILPQMSVSCERDKPCAVYTKQAGASPKTTEILINKPPIKLGIDIPNNNLEITRRAVSDRPALYQDSNFGPLLTPLRSVLESQAKFAECVDLDDTEAFLLCSLSTDPKAIKSVMLLAITMNGACGNLPFCAYYFVPLERIRTK